METLFLTDTHPQSGRTAVICAEADSIWLYLSLPGQQRPERDCWLPRGESFWLRTFVPGAR